MFIINPDLLSNRCLKMISVDELTVPRDPWQRVFDKNQKRYNAQLMAGVGVLTGTVFVFANSVYFNTTPTFLKSVNIETRMPEKPGKEKTVECSAPEIVSLSC